jgi:hypothetical protein
MSSLLSPQQINFFNTFGYLKLPGLFADKVDEFSARFDDIFRSREAEVIDWRGQAPRYKQRRSILQFMERDPEFCRLLDDPRILEIFTSFCGADFAFRGSEANIFECGTSWHSDSYGALFKYTNVRIVFYLDPVDENSGALRFIPGSHHMGQSYARQLTHWLEDGDSFQRDLGLDDKQVPSVVVPSEPGDAVIFNYGIKHAACYEGNPRRMFALWASQHMTSEDVEKIRKGLKLTAKFGYDSYYGEEMVATASQERMRHLSLLKDLRMDDLLADDTDDNYSKDWQQRQVRPR